MEEKIYLCIDLKSFYASVECVERGLDPMTTNLIVADPDRKEKTVCLAITPAMKKLGIKNRCRVFEIPKSVEYIKAEPRMQLYIDYAAEIYAVYLEYISKDDIYVYSIDEVFIDATKYLPFYNVTPKQLAQKLMGAVLEKTGVRATCGIGTNMYLAKVALDITAKHADDFIGILDVETYKKTLHEHRPLTDFWRVGHGTAKKLMQRGLYTMGDIARADEDIIYDLLGVDAELLIDHANGIEPVTIADIKAYKPKSNSIASGQVLMKDYTASSAEIIVKEMIESICLEMIENELVSNSITLTIGYSREHQEKSAHGTISLEKETNERTLMLPATVKLYRQIINPALMVRRINITINRTKKEEKAEQMSFFEEEQAEKKSKEIQKTIIDIKKHFGKNAVLKGIDLTEGATARDRNRQIGGHKSGEK